MDGRDDGYGHGKSGMDPQDWETNIQKVIKLGINTLMQVTNVRVVAKMMTEILVQVIKKKTCGKETAVGPMSQKWGIRMLRILEKERQVQAAQAMPLLL